MHLEDDTPRSTKLGLDNSGEVVVKNRAWRRRRKNVADIEGKPHKYYTTKQVKVRKKKSGKRTKITKKSS